MATRTPWSHALSLADQTPPQRNRWVDALRALSILAVVVGHWLVAAPYVAADGELVGAHLLGLQPWTQWLTWGFQVMPLFFLVGGYSNGVSWAAVQRRGDSYSGWLAGRLQRLVNPVLPLFLGWVAFITCGRLLGASAETIQLASALALVPVWFLAVYILVVALVPLGWMAWQRFGLRSFWALAAAVLLVDLLRFSVGLEWLAPANFLFVWVGIHQLGYAWQAGALSGDKSGTGRALAWAAGGLVTLLALVALGRYPVAMIGVPGEAVSNSMPPTLALFALGVLQAGLALAVEPLARRLLQRRRLWAAAVLVNGMIMTLYLWHLTAFVLVSAVAWAAGIGLDAFPGSAAWWATRPLWLAVFALATLPFIAVFGRVEQGAVPVAERVSAWRLMLGVALVCGGLAATAAGGIGSAEWTGFRVWVVALPLLGAALVDIGPLAHRRRRPAPVVT